MATIKKGTYRLNDILTVPNGGVAGLMPLEFTVQLTINSTEYFVTCHALEYYHPTSSNYGYALSYRVKEISPAYSVSSIQVYQFGTSSWHSYGGTSQIITIPKDTDADDTLATWFAENTLAITYPSYTSYTFKQLNVVYSESLGNGYALQILSAKFEFVEKDGLLYLVDSDSAEVRGRTDETITDIVIPSKVKGVPVTWIDGSAFHGTNITSVIIPDSVKQTGTAVFAECHNLKNVVIGNGLYNIYAELFWNCKSLKTVTIGKSVQSIGLGAFSGCDSLTDVYYWGTEEQWNSLPKGSDNDALLNATIHYNYLPAGLYDENDVLVASWDTLVNTYGMDCEKTYSYDTHKTDTASPYYVLNNIGALSSRKLVISDSVTKIGARAFTSCKIASITLPNSITSIGYSAFNANLIESLTIPDSVTSIGDYAFFRNVRLKSITIGSGVSAIGKATFSETSIASIAIPSGVTSIGEEAFMICSALTSIIIPDSVITIGKNAFNYCTSLTDVYYGGTEEEWANITIANQNGSLISATIHYNYTG